MSSGKASAHARANKSVVISGRDFVFVTRPSGGGFIANRLPVTLGDIHQNGYVALDGMKSDEKVVVSDVQRLYERLAIAPTDKVATNSAKATQKPLVYVCNGGFFIRR
ncbi:MAG: hypothetical protein IPI39_21270 [Candidatus Obscuribacter sp.]|nr:hypothetical protein [Candidatus Obscuribacter sp.]